MSDILLIVFTLIFSIPAFFSCLWLTWDNSQSFMTGKHEGLSIMNFILCWFLSLVPLLNIFSIIIFICIFSAKKLPENKTFQYLTEKRFCVEKENG